MSKVKLERSLELAKKILMLNKKNSNILITLINQMVINESINKNKKQINNDDNIKQKQNLKSV